MCRSALYDVSLLLSQVARRSRLKLGAECVARPLAIPLSLAAIGTIETEVAVRKGGT